MTEGYCMKCKSKHEMKDITTTITKQNMEFAKGKCSVCNGVVCKIIGKAKTETLETKKE